MSINFFVIPVLVAGMAYYDYRYSKQGFLWYDSLHKPKNTPSSELLGSIWTFLYITLAAAVLWFWNIPAFSWYQYVVGAALLGNLALHLHWSKIFLVNHSLSEAQRKIVWLDVAGVVTLILIGYKAAIAALLFLPYLVWLALVTQLLKEMRKRN